MLDDEPESGKETVLTLNLSVKSDLEPVWTLVSERAEARDQTRYLTWSDRNRLCPTRIGAFAENDLAWRRGSVLTKLSDEKAETSGAMAEAARVLRPQGTLALLTLAEHVELPTTAGYGHVRAGFSPPELRRWLEQAGLSVDQCALTSRERQKPFFEVVSAFAHKPHAPNGKPRRRSRKQDQADP